MRVFLTVRCASLFLTVRATQPREFFNSSDRENKAFQPELLKKTRAAACWLPELLKKTRVASPGRLGWPGRPHASFLANSSEGLHGLQGCRAAALQVVWCGGESLNGTFKDSPPHHTTPHLQGCSPAAMQPCSPGPAARVRFPAVGPCSPCSPCPCSPAPAAMQPMQAPARVFFDSSGLAPNC